MKTVLNAFHTGLAGVLAMLLVVGLVLAPAPVGAQDTAKATEASALPVPLSKESIRELVARQSDVQVRQLLIEQLDRGAAPVAATDAAGADGGRSIDDRSEMLRARMQEIVAGAAQTGATLAQVGGRIVDGRDPATYWLVAVGFAGMLFAGWILEMLIRRLLATHWRRIEQQEADSLGAQTARFALLLAFEAAALTAFTAGAAMLFLALWQGHAPTRYVVLLMLTSVVGVRFMASLARLVLQPGMPALRLLPFDDFGARVMYRGLVRLAILWTVMTGGADLLAQFGAPQPFIDFVMIVCGVIFIALAIDSVWRLRAEVGALIRPRENGQPLRRLIADIWPGLVTAFLLVVFASWVSGILMRDMRSSAGIISLLVLLLVPLADMLLCRILDAIVGNRPGAPGEAVVPVAGYEAVFKRAIHVVVIVIGLAVLAGVWQLDLFAIAEKGLGGRISGALVGIGITVLMSHVLWELIKTGIDRRMQAENLGDGQVASRLRTLLPLLRMTVMITILLMATLSILASLGVNIVPLIAGFGVLGVAIGFGSQSLVRDIVSGAFFLSDDAFRLGEYVEVGSDKGTVEKITIRSLFLRHHRGPINVLPYGEIKRLRNLSRDWMIMVMEFNLAYDTDLKLVKQIVKGIGKDISEDPELGPSLIEPLKSGGVRSTAGGGLTVRVKFTARPTGEPFGIRRVAYERIVAAFAESGIRFAVPRVTVVDPRGGPVVDNHGTVEAAAAMRIEQSKPTPAA